MHFTCEDSARSRAYYEFCCSRMQSSLKEWRYQAKKHWKTKWQSVAEDQRRPFKGISDEDWLQLIAFFDSEKAKKVAATNFANKAKSVLKHTTGSVAFADFELHHSTVGEDGTRVWPSPSQAWLLEHTRRPAPDSTERQFLDPVSADLHKRIVEVEVEQSVDSCSGPLSHPTDVVLTQHHNRRTGRGSAFAPLQKGRGRGRLDTQLEEQFQEEARQRVELRQQLEEERASRMELQGRFEQIEQMLRNMQSQPQPQPQPPSETQTSPSQRLD